MASVGFTGGGQRCRRAQVWTREWASDVGVTCTPRGSSFCLKDAAGVSMEHAGLMGRLPCGKVGGGDTRPGGSVQADPAPERLYQILGQ